MDTESLKAQGTGYNSSMKTVVEHATSGPERLVGYIKYVDYRFDYIFLG